jgi:hypothetical protein
MLLGQLCFGVESRPNTVSPGAGLARSRQALLLVLLRSQQENQR